MPSADSTAVIGAGIAGLSCARALHDGGAEVTVFDKARGPSGRASTRRMDNATFDHGAQYFTARSPEFRAVVDAWLDTGVAAPWNGRIVALAGGVIEELTDQPERFVGSPTMSSLARGLAQDLTIETGFRVGALERDGDSWRLCADDGRTAGPFGRVVVTAPAAQAARLLTAAPTLADRAAPVAFTPCWSVMLTADDRLPLDFDGAFVNAPSAPGALSWIARDSSKPGRPAGERWVLHGSPEWSAERVDAGPAAVADALVEAFGRATGTFPRAIAASAHLWRYALPPEPLPDRFLFDPASGLAACGDWCGGPRIEGAWQSGTAMAARLLQ